VFDEAAPFSSSERNPAADGDGQRFVPSGDGAWFPVIFRNGYQALPLFLSNPRLFFRSCIRAYLEISFGLQPVAKAMNSVALHRHIFDNMPASSFAFMSFSLSLDIKYYYG